MHAVVRNYSGKGTKALFDLLEKNKGEVESLIRGIFVGRRRQRLPVNDAANIMWDLALRRDCGTDLNAAQDLLVGLYSKPSLRHAPATQSRA